MQSVVNNECKQMSDFQGLLTLQLLNQFLHFDDVALTIFWNQEQIT